MTSEEYGLVDSAQQWRGGRVVGYKDGFRYFSHSDKIKAWRGTNRYRILMTNGDVIVVSEHQIKRFPEDM